MSDVQGMPFFSLFHLLYFICDNKADWIIRSARTAVEWRHYSDRLIYMAKKNEDQKCTCSSFLHSPYFLNSLEMPSKVLITQVQSVEKTAI